MTIFDREIEAAQLAKRAAYDSYRAQLQAGGMSRGEAKAEINAFKEAMTLLRATDEKRRSIEEGHDLALTIYIELAESAGTNSATRSATREAAETEPTAQSQVPKAPSRKPANRNHHSQREDSEVSAHGSDGGDHQQGDDAVGRSVGNIAVELQHRPRLGAEREDPRANLVAVADDTASRWESDGASLKIAPPPTKISTEILVGMDHASTEKLGSHERRCGPFHHNSQESNGSCWGIAGAVGVSRIEQPRRAPYGPRI